MPYFKDEEFIRAIMMTAMRLENMASRSLLRDFQLSAAGVSLLVMLKKRGPCSPTELKRLAGSSKSNITQRLNLLLKKGLIEREHSQQDGRIIKVRLSEQGEQITQHILDKLAIGELHASKFFSPEELAAHVAFFRKLNDLIDQHSPDGLTCPQCSDNNN